MKSQLDKKTCSMCKELKSIYDFNYQNKRRGYLQARCKFCDRLASKISYQQNREKNISKNKNWIEKNRKLHNFNVRMYRSRKREGITWGIF